MGIIEVDGVSKVYGANGARGAGTTALDRLSLDVEVGEFVSVLGPSGCGKTTLLFLLAGFTGSTTGEVRFKGATVTGPGPERAVMFQDYGLLPWLTVRRNIAFGLGPKGLPRSEVDDRVAALVELVRLRGFEEAYPHQISGGMKQRVSIARALAPDPDVLLMDEPFAALDALSREQMQEEIVGLWERTGKTVVLVTHSIDEALFLSDRIFVLTKRPGTLRESLSLERAGARSRRDGLARREHLYRLLHREMGEGA